LHVADSTASVPEGSNPIDVAALVKYYLASIPEPLTTFELYNEIRGARSNIYSMRNILKRLSSVNYMTLEFITALLLRASQKSLLNKVGDFCNWFHSIISSLAELSSNCIATIL
jgi:hypothetical protein